MGRDRIASEHKATRCQPLGVHILWAARRQRTHASHGGFTLTRLQQGRRAQYQALRLLRRQYLHGIEHNERFLRLVGAKKGAGEVKLSTHILRCSSDAAAEVIQGRVSVASE